MLLTPSISTYTWVTLPKKHVVGASRFPEESANLGYGPELPESE